MTACRASSNESPLKVAMDVKFSREYAFDISFITRSRILPVKVGGKWEISLA